MPPLVTISREGSVSTETRRVAVTALAGLVVLALPGAIASSDVAGAALVDLGALAQCDVQETLCPDDDLEPREPASRRPDIAPAPTCAPFAPPSFSISGRGFFQNGRQAGATVPTAAGWLSRNQCGAAYV